MLGNLSTVEDVGTVVLVAPGTATSGEFCRHCRILEQHFIEGFELLLDTSGVLLEKGPGQGFLFMRT